MRRKLAGILTMSFVLCAAMPIAAQQSTTTGYTYDANGRLRTVTLPNGHQTIYSYDPAGNITSVTHAQLDALSIIEVSPNSGLIGSTVSLTGFGFDATASANVVEFTSATGRVTAQPPISQTATTSHLDVMVPEDAVTGPVYVTTPTGTDESPDSFVVTTGLAVTGFTPTRGSSGNLITISGTDFESTNTVTFNDLVAVVESSTPTELVVQVPAGPASGIVKVSNVNGFAPSATNFMALPPPYVDSDVQFVDTVTLGEPKSLTFNQTNPTNPNRIGILRFSYTGTPAPLRLDIRRTAGDTMTFEPLAVYRPDMSRMVGVNGSGVSTSQLVSPGEYLIVFNPAGVTTGATTMSVTPATDLVGTIRADGQPVSIDGAVAGQDVSLLFEGVDGQRICLRTRGTSAFVTVYRPNGEAYLSLPPAVPVQYGGGRFFEPVELMDTGTYRIWIEAPQGVTLTGTVALYDVPPNLLGEISKDGDPVPTTVSFPGQIGYQTFTAVQGEKLSVRVTGRDPVDPPPAFGVSVVSYPSGLPGAIQFTGSDPDFLAVTLPQAGTYAVTLDPFYDLTGAATLQLLSRPSVTGTISPIHSDGSGGSPVAVTSTLPWQETRLSFTLASPQQIRLRKTDTSGSLIARVETAAGQPIGGEFFSTTAGEEISGLWPPGGPLAAGNYVLVCQFGDVATTPSYTGSGTIALYDGSSSSGTLVVGQPLTIPFTPGYERVSLSVPSAQGRSIRVQVSGSPFNMFVRRNGEVMLFQGTLTPEDGQVVIVEDLSTSLPVDMQVLNVNAPYAGTVTITLIEAP